MPATPRISVVTASYNQGKFIGRTIESVLAQNYPNLEHIVVDGMSTDDTPAVLARYPHLRVLREPDRGQADAINKGFRLATGDVYCFLNSDDTFLPGALHRVAAELSPARGRHIVTGRCIYVDENDKPTGAEHPSGPMTHRRVLEVWKVHAVPQPSTFWTPDVWRRCGALDVSDQLVLDYDLMCRFSRHYALHFIDQVLATFRLHAASKSCSHASEEIYAQAIRASRRYWGSPLGPRYWLLRWSLSEHRFEKRWGRRSKAARLAGTAYAAWGQGKRLRGAARGAAAALLGPEVLVPRFLARLCSGARRSSAGQDRTTGQPGPLSPLTRAWWNFTGQHPDGPVGPKFVTTVDTGPTHRSLRVVGRSVLEGCPQPRSIAVSVDGRVVHRHRADGGPSFSLAVPLGPLRPGPHEVTIASDTCFVPHEYVGNEDYRPLAFRLIRLALSEERAEGARPSSASRAA